VDSLTLTYIIIGAAGLIGFASFAVLIFAPTWTAYGRTWERLAAAFLSVFVLAAFAGAGVAVGLVLLYYWDELLTVVGLEAALTPLL
jgi:hypothetical protein